MVTKFTWDDRKEAENIRKHGVDFANDATSVFRDALAEEYHDPDHSSATEERYLLFGLSSTKGLLVVSYLYEDEETAHIISARKMTPKERKDHEEGI